MSFLITTGDHFDGWTVVDYLGVVRGTSEFADTRYRVWQALHAPIGTLH